MTTPEQRSISVRYALEQLARALRALRGRGAREDEDTPKARVERWRAVVDGITRGHLTPGRRAPIDGVPVWATPEVVHGGFVTGRLLAERAAPEGPPPTDVDGSTDQGRWNRHYLTRADCDGEIDLPEAAALPTVRALAARGHVEEAIALLDELLPWFERLRFHPLPPGDATPASTSDMAAIVRRRTARQVAEELGQISPVPRIERMRVTLTTGAELVDGFTALFLSTLDGEPPRHVDGQTVGGWPCAQFPPDFDARARRLLEQFDEAEPRLSARLCRGNLGRFVQHARGCLQWHERGLPQLVRRDQVRHTLANVLTRRGLPGSPEHRALRAAQALNAAVPRRSDLAHILAERLAAVPHGVGIATLDPFMHPITDAEAASSFTPAPRAGTPMPAEYLARLRLCTEGTVQELIDAGIVTSSETLAEVLPSLTAHVEASSFEDPALGVLYGALYAAFRRRRTLLLLDYAQQIRLSELPWAAALVRHRGAVASNAVQRRVYETVSRLALQHFPHTPPPNPLVTELRRLAGEPLPWVAEIAADIFMGSFVRVFGEAAARARSLLAGTIYARYYDLPTALRGSPPDAGTRHDEAFRKECERRALEARPTVVKGAGASSVALNGTILEQAQILTTQNMATWVQHVGLSRTLPRLDLARRCLAATLQGFAPSTGDHHADLRRTKQAAAAWRHTLFWLSLAPDGAIETLIAEAYGAGEDLAPEHAARFDLVLGGLAAIARGKRFDSAGRVAGGRRFLGWSAGPHWVLGG